MLLTHFSSDSPAVISPTAIIPKIPGIPSRAVSCFSHLTFSRLLDTLGGEPVAKTATANMDITVYKTLFKGVPLALFMIPVGEPAAIGIMEEAAGLSAWAKFRGKTLLHFFYAADNLDSEAWDPRSLSHHALLDEKDKIALLAAEAAIRI